MRARIREWAKHELRRQESEHGAGVERRLRDLKAKTILALAIRRPRALASYLRTQWILTMPMPGDRFEDFQLCEVYEVLEAKPGRPWRIRIYDTVYSPPDGPAGPDIIWPEALAYRTAGDQVKANVAQDLERAGDHAFSGAPTRNRGGWIAYRPAG